ncbi:hypothetical protein J437_LFUL006748 [Ladona fulva]|uniref:DDE-1 domain-containing protein n=1 Tax=Ladona fulva TaxID=123851 RepID=A0A8K0K172_LADFU|nr:hypothetical protein J437_LFUL006748 [Ladona fulva]
MTKKDAPPGSTFDAQMSGWITKDGFQKWMKAFDERVNPTQKSPVLLIRDDHSSHKDLNIILYAKQNHIHMIILRVDPYRKYPNMKITLKDKAGLVNSAFSRICRMELAQYGFECTGIYLLDRNVVTDQLNSETRRETKKSDQIQTSTNPEQKELHQSAGVSNLPDRGGPNSDNPVDHSPMLNQPLKVGPSHVSNWSESPNKTCGQLQAVAILMSLSTQQILAQIFTTT